MAATARTGVIAWARARSWGGPIAVGYTVFSIILVTATLSGLTATGPFAGLVGYDASAYYAADPTHPYIAQEYGEPGGFYYAPAFAHAIAPLTELPWPVFLSALTAANLAALWYLLGSWAILALVWPLVWAEFLGGNIDLLIAAAMAAGFRYPAAWAFVALTKVTPAIGILWFLVRREWRDLATVVAATLAVVAVSYLLAPSAWWDWVGLLTGNAGSGDAFLPRLLAAGALVVGGALAGRRWVIPIAAVLAMPVIWPAHLTLLLAVPRLLLPDRAPPPQEQGASSA